jgi:hypothetical protein
MNKHLAGGIVNTNWLPAIGERIASFYMAYLAENANSGPHIQ